MVAIRVLKNFFDSVQKLFTTVANSCRCGGLDPMTHFVKKLKRAFHQWTCNTCANFVGFLSGCYVLLPQGLVNDVGGD